MKHCVDILSKLGVSYEDRIASAHRTPDRTAALVRDAEGRGFKVIIAAAGWAAALPGDVAAHTNVLPVFGVPIGGRGTIDNLAAILAMVDLPPGMPVGVLSLGKAGAINAALLAAAVIGISNLAVREALHIYRQEQTDLVPERPEYNPPAKS